METTLSPKHLVEWDHSLPLNFQTECLLHMAVYGLKNPSLINDTNRGLYEVLKEDFESDQQKLSQKTKRSSSVSEWKPAKTLNKAVAIDSSRKKTSFKPLNFVDYFENCIRGYHSQFNYEDKILWDLFADTREYLEKLFVPYIAKDNSLWPDSASEFSHQYFGFGRCTLQKEHNKFVAEGIIYSKVPDEINTESSFGNIVFAANSKEDLSLQDLENIVANCASVKFSHGPAAIDWKHEKALAIVVFSSQIDCFKICLLNDPTVDPYLVIDFKYDAHKSEFGSLKKEKNRFAVVPFDAVQNTLGKKPKISKKPRIVSSEKIPLFFISSMFSTPPRVLKEFH